MQREEDDDAHRQFWSSIRKKVVVARKNVRDDKVFDGALVMQKMIDQLSAKRPRPGKKRDENA